MRFYDVIFYLMDVPFIYPLIKDLPISFYNNLINGFWMTVFYLVISLYFYRLTGKIADKYPKIGYLQYFFGIPFFLLARLFRGIVFPFKILVFPFKLLYVSIKHLFLNKNLSIKFTFKKNEIRSKSESPVVPVVESTTTLKKIKSNSNPNVNWRDYDSPTCLRKGKHLIF